MAMPMLAPLCSVVLMAVKRQEPQQTCPQGVSVALVGGKKQIGQVYSESGSAGAGGGFGDLDWVGGGGGGGRIGERDMAVALLLPFPFPFPFFLFLRGNFGTSDSSFRFFDK